MSQKMRTIIKNNPSTISRIGNKHENYLRKEIDIINIYLEDLKKCMHLIVFIILNIEYWLQRWRVFCKYLSSLLRSKIQYLSYIQKF